MGEFETLNVVIPGRGPLGREPRILTPALRSMDSGPGADAPSRNDRWLRPLAVTECDTARFVRRAMRTTKALRLIEFRKLHFESK